MPAGRITADPGNYFAVAVQSAKDVEGSTFYFTKHLDGTGFDTEQEVASERIGGGGREVGLRYRTGVKADGQLVQYGWPDGTGRMLAWAGLLDEPTVVVATSSAENELVRHFMRSGGTQLPYLTVEQNWADETERTSNAVVSSLKIEGEATRPLKFTTQFISAGTPRTPTQTLVALRETGGPYMESGASAAIEVNDTTPGESAGGPAVATSNEVTKWSLEIKNALDDAIHTLSLQRNDVTWLTVDYDLDGTVKYTDKNLWNQIVYNGGFVGNKNFLATGAFVFFTRPLYEAQASFPLEIRLPFLEISAAKVNRLDPDGKTMYLDFTAMNVANATFSLFANVTTKATGAYTSPTT
jgi:hypothetical protein